MRFLTNTKNKRQGTTYIVIPCLCSFTVPSSPFSEPLANKKRTRTLFHKESGSSTNCMVGQEGLEPVKDAEQEQHLHGQQDEDQSRAAEDHPENPPLALFQKVYPCFFGILFHNKPSLLEITKISANLMQQQFLTFIISLKSPI